MLSTLLNSQYIQLYWMNAIMFLDLGKTHKTLIEIGLTNWHYRPLIPFTILTPPHLPFKIVNCAIHHL